MHLHWFSLLFYTTTTHTTINVELINENVVESATTTSYDYSNYIQSKVNIPVQKFN